MISLIVCYSDIDIESGTFWKVYRIKYLENITKNFF